MSLSLNARSRALAGSAARSRTEWWNRISAAGAQGGEIHTKKLFPHQVTHEAQNEQQNQRPERPQPPSFHIKSNAFFSLIIPIIIRPLGGHERDTANIMAKTAAVPGPDKKSLAIMQKVCTMFTFLPELVDAALHYSAGFQQN